MRRKRSFVPWNLILLGFHLFGFILAVLSHEGLKPGEIFLRNLINNWGTNPFQNITVFKDNCPNNYEPVNINKYVLTCDLTHQLDYFEQESRAKQIPLKTSRNETFCGLRMANFNYFYFSASSKCAEHQKSCGYIDTLYNHLCIGTNQTCPINGLKIINNKNIKNLIGTVKLEEEYLSINQNFSLLIENDNRSKNASLVVDLELIKDTKVNEVLNCDPYYFWKISKSGNNTTVSQRSEVKKEYIRRMKQDELLIVANKLGNSHKIHSSDTPSHTLHSGHTLQNTNYRDEYTRDNYARNNHKKNLKKFGLESRPYIGWKLRCLKSQTKSPEKIKDFLKKHTIIYDRSNNLVVTYLFFLAGIFFFTIFIFPFLFQGDNKTQSVVMLVIFMLMLLFSIFSLFENISESWHLLYSGKNSTSKFENCSDIHTNKKILSIGNNLRFLMNISTFLAVCVLTSFSVSLYHAVVNLNLNKLDLSFSFDDGEKERLN